MFKKTLAVVATMILGFGLFAGVAQPVKASSGDVKRIAEAGEILSIPTCSWSNPEGFYTSTSAYTYLGRVPVSEPSSKYPGTWECSTVIRHLVRLNWTTMWSPLSSRYGTAPEFFRARSRGIDPTNEALGMHTDQNYEIRSVQVLNHFYDAMSVAYQTTSYTNFSLKKIVGGSVVTIDPASIGYTLNTTSKCAGGNDDRLNCRWIHKFNTGSLETATYRIDFSDTNTGGVGASKGGNYQVFFYQTR
jgi:hypothetical protein